MGRSSQAPTGIGQRVRRNRPTPTHEPSRGDLFGIHGGDRCLAAIGLDAPGSRGQDVLVVAALVTPGRGTGQAVVVDSSRDRLASVRLPAVDSQLCASFGHGECTNILGGESEPEPPGGGGLKQGAGRPSPTPLTLGRTLSYLVVDAAFF